MEYDKCNHIRFKSVEKLLFSKADVAIGVVRGNPNSHLLATENIQRIKQTAKELGFDNTAIFLIIIDNRISEWVYVSVRKEP